MESLYDNYLTRDARLLVKDKVHLPVSKGASSFSFQTIQANEKSTSLVDFQFTPPSESVFLPRKAEIEYNMTFQVVIVKPTGAGGVANGTNVFAPGQNVCFQSYPLHRLATHAQININNSQIDCNVPNVLTALLQMQDEENMVDWSTSCPIMSDRYAKYTDAVVSNLNNPFLGYEQAYSKHILPRGAHPISITAVDREGADNSLLATGANPETFTITFTLSGVEPILIPPFIAGKAGEETAGFLGVNRLNIRYNLNANAKRLMSTALPFTSFTCTLLSVNDAKLHISYLSGDTTQLVPSRVVHTYYQLYDYVGNSTNAIADAGTQTYTSQNLQLSEIPDRFIIFARKSYSNVSAKDPDAVLPMSNLSVSFNNKTSLLSQLTPSELYLMSKRNGLNNVDFRQFVGKALKLNTGYNAGANGTQNDLYLSGGVIVIDPSRDLSIYEPFLVNGSTGQFNFSWQATVSNNSGAQINSVDLITIPVYLRLLETTPGFSSVRQPAFNQAQISQVIENGVLGPALPQEDLLGGEMSKVVARGVSGGARSGGKQKDVSKVMSKLDALLM